MAEEIYLDELEGDVVEISKTFDAPHNTVVLESEGIFYYIRVYDDNSIMAACQAFATCKRLKLRMGFQVVD